METLAFGLGGFRLFFFAFWALPTLFWIWMLVDVARRQFADQSAKILWFLLVLFLYTLGGLIYFFVGRRQGQLS